jgi:hypothetical protein
VNITFDPRSAALLGHRAQALQISGAELGALGEHDPELAGECGVEICSLEARTILSAGAPARVQAISQEAARANRPAVVSARDVDALSRLEAVVAMGSSRIALKLAAMDAAAAQEPAARLGNIVTLATSAAGAIGFLKGIL